MSDSILPSSSETDLLLAEGAELLEAGKFKKALKKFNQAYELEHSNMKVQRWQKRAEWLQDYVKDDFVQKNLTASISQSKKNHGYLFQQRAAMLRELHLAYGIFLARLGEYQDSEKEAAWLDKNAGTGMAKDVRTHIEAYSCTESSVNIFKLS